LGEIASVALICFCFHPECFQFLFECCLLWARYYRLHR
jgi:hypothetical protein